jgi:hypothetical protein
VLARDIYRDLYEDSGPTTGEKIALAGKRLGIVLACGALLLGALDFGGVHSIPGVSSFVQSARMKIVGGVEPPRHQSAKASPVEVVRVAIPKSAPKPKPSGPSPADAIAAAGRKDAVSMAMNSRALTIPSLFAPKRSASAETSAPVAAASPTVIQNSPAAAPIAAKPEVPASLADVKTQTSSPQPAQAAMQLSDIASRSQASVPPTASIQLASLPAPTRTLEPIATVPADSPIVASMQALIPLDKVMLPRAAPPLSPAERLELSGKEYARAERCLANAIYFEARSEPIRGQMAVAQVVINRVFSGFYPNDVCGVVYQNAHRHLACQFTFACDGKSKAITDRRHWAIANRIARQTLDGQIYVPEVGKSTHYHAAYVRPNWVREMRKLVRYGLHSFYRPYAWGNGNEEPVWGPAETTARVHKTASR